MATQVTTTWTKKTVNGYVTAESDISAVLAGATDSLASTAIVEDIGRKKVIVGFNITTAYSAAATVDFVVQGSMDNSNWVALATAAADLGTESSTGQRIYLVDLSTIQAPYYRLIVNTGGSSIGTSGKGKFSYAVKTDTVNIAV